MRMVLMLAPTNVSRVGPATEEQRVDFSYKRIGKNRDTSELTVLIPLRFRLPRRHTQSGAWNSPRYTPRLTHLPDSQASALPRHLVLLLNIALSLEPPKETGSPHHPPSTILWGLHGRATRMSQASGHVIEVTLSYPPQTPSFVPRRHWVALAANLIMDTTPHLAT